ncbi:hypothetical protein [Neptuniibacter caesariensis]|uniref:Uncharacterized protein n=1 Tax=Neptuniibacter caesariensis TaxID=207954 RepID=A0A7U8C2U0_NEPCE|nr:hypothetical protein [Neptuniibacter caesariensis]EAR60467.1 hypothetical protein MED92_09061 [Oceanospirillum sp. MED92] [Neptuniibacter caesariensis]
MEQNLEVLLKQADDLREGIQKIHNDSKMMGYNSAGIRDCALTLQKCIKKVGNNKLAALAARDKRKVYAEMEDAIEQLLEFID